MTQPVPRRILFVDDEPAMTQLGKVVLERAGHLCSMASNGDEGLQKLLEEHPDLVILDYMMPGMTGAEMFRILRTSHDCLDVRDTPVLMLTAKTENDAERRELMELGLAAYLTKPFGHRELLNVIDNVLVTSDVQRQTRQLMRDLKLTYLGAIQVLIGLLAVKDPYSEEHAGMVSALAVAVAEQYGLSEAEVESIRLAALLHDIGKVGVPERIVCKPTSLDPDEMAEMRKHVDFGVQALEAIPTLREIAQLVAGHHERIDGTGYPNGRAADDIPLGARIVTVVDAFDAMISDQPYRAAVSKDEAISRLRDCAGTQFDADIVEYFVEALEKGIGEVDRRQDQQRQLRGFSA